MSGTGKDNWIQNRCALRDLAKRDTAWLSTGKNVGIFSRRALNAGINLARFHTPMVQQAYHVLALVWKRVQWRFFAWRGIQTQLSFNRNTALRSAENGFLRALEIRKQAIIRRQHQVAKPLTTHYQLIPISP